ncbi:HNH endonuclease [Pantoea dispersa]|uniref:HNH endonuclease n=1 Tax=Pantoea dispersa TaxID=59814 RepID=UPI0021F7EA20|nr:HNH endonuclease domain-containing protein [Pantoea dispersa]UYP73494.1 HNH endonuclease [Pantoea dispersa]
MADIENEYTFSAEDLETLELIKGADFSHLSWGDESLAEIKRKIRDFYRNEQHGECAFCKNDISLRSAFNCTIEHIIPKSQYIEFMFTGKNLCVICADCNEIKRAQEVANEIHEVINGTARRVRYPRSTTAFRIVHPHFDSWNDHIIRFGRAYIDKTSKGINTIAICNLNRFFHKFEVGEEYITETDLTGMMEEYLTCQSLIQRAELLLRIKSALR